ncbi:MAG: TonB-dependent receptor [Pseudomonadota bacterium]
MSHWLRVLVCAASLVLASGAGADDGDQTPASTILPPAPAMQVTATATPEQATRTGRLISTVEVAQALNEVETDLPDALEALPGLSLQRSSGNGGSPILRGLVGPQVLVLVDGVRLNNSIWREGPVQYLNAIELGSLQRVEVLRGPGSVLHGSDALGGVVHLRTKDPTFVDEGFAVQGNLVTTFRSASETLLGHTEVDAGAPALALRVGGDLGQIGNLRGGRDTGMQDFSGYRRGGLDAKLSYEPRAGHRLQSGVLALRQIDAPRPDKCARYDGGRVRDCRTMTEQFIDLGSLRYRGVAGQLLDEVETILSVQNFHEKTERLRWDRALVETRQDDVLTLGGHLLLSRRFSVDTPLHARFSAGGEVYHDLVDSQAWRRSVRGIDAEVASAPGERTPELATVADGSSYTSMGVFAEQRLAASETWAAVLGVRLSGYQARASDPTRLGHDLDRSFAAPSASLSGEAQVFDGLRLGLSLMHGFRAPNLYDLTGRDQFGGGYEFADALNLGPERLSGAELVARWDLGPFSAELAGHASVLHDLIVRQPGRFAGQELHDGVPVFMRVNAGLATIVGVESEAHLQLPASTELVATFAYTHGQDLTHDEPLSRIPPATGSLGVRSQPVDGLLLGSEALWALTQDRLSARDRSDPRIAEGGTPGFFVLGLFASYRILQAVRLSARLHNLFDQSYRVHGSGLDGPGVEGRVRLELAF